MVLRQRLNFGFCFASCDDEAQAPATSIAATIPIVFNPCRAVPAAIWRSDRPTHAQAAPPKTVRIQDRARFTETHTLCNSGLVVCETACNDTGHMISFQR